MQIVLYERKNRIAEQIRILESMMLYVHATTKLAKAVHVKLGPAPEGMDARWIDSWYANVFKMEHHGQAVLLTNPETLYTIVIPIASKSIPLFAVLEQFRGKLAMAMGANGASSSVIKTIVNDLQQFQVYKTANRSVLGSMNDMVFHAQYLAEHRPECSVETIEAQLNRIPLSPLGYGYSVEKFASKILLTT